MSSRYLVLLLFLGFEIVHADYSQDYETITKLAGCFETEIEFREGKEDELSSQKFASRSSLKKKGIELVIVEKDDTRELSLVHLLLPIEGSVLNLRGWRQSWVFQGRELFQYLGDYQWKKYLLPQERMKGHWIEKISHLDGSPDRQCIGEWNQRAYYSHWKCAARGPLPERDFDRAQYFDYTIQVHDTTLLSGPISKVLMDEEVSKWKGTLGREDIVAMETSKGFYQAIDSYFCNAGRQWWEVHQGRLGELNHSWDTLYAEFDFIRLKGARSQTSQKSLEVWKNLQAKFFRSLATRDQDSMKPAKKGWSEYLKWFPVSQPMSTPKTPKEWLQEDWEFLKIPDEDRATVFENNDEFSRYSQ